jgi:hypothetical protein
MQELGGPSAEGPLTDPKQAKLSSKSLNPACLLSLCVCMQDLGGPSAEGPLTDPKQALEHMLDTLGNGMRGMDYEV